jgi:hypothetical protein
MHFENLFAVDAGFDPHNIAVLDVSSELSDMTQKPQLNEFADELQRRVESLAGVQSADTARWVSRRATSPLCAFRFSPAATSNRAIATITRRARLPRS